MSKFPALTCKKLIQFLEKQGFAAHRTSGSHVILYHPASRRRAVVPFHTKDIPKGTLFAILKSGGFSKEDYMRLS